MIKPQAMRILLVEDDEDKRHQLSLFFVDTFKAEVVEAKSLNSGVKALFSSKYDLIVLDMSMSTFDSSLSDKTGGRPQPYGGREILMQMKRKAISTKAVVVTQYDNFGQNEDLTSLYELDKQLKLSFPNTYIGAISYKGDFVGWQSRLAALLKKENIIK